MDSADFSSQEMLDRMLHEGKIDRQEYDRLRAALGENQTKGEAERRKERSMALPWQIWVVIVLLALVGLGNLVAIPRMPIAAFWLAAKCVMILGLWKGWKAVFILTIILASIHALFFALLAPFVALINALLVVLLITARDYYFPKARIPLTERP